MKTNSNNINNSKSNKTKPTIALTSLIIVLSIVNITLLTGTIFGININTTTNASALSYSTSEDVSFTFAPTLSIGLSTNSLTIDNLVPGTANDSNTVTVTVSSNTPYGYVLSAGVGSNDTTSPYYNTSSLTHENSTISNVFSSVDTNASLDSLDTDNTWGYSTSTDGGTSWSTYSGLSHTTTKPLLDISDPATPSTIDFKIAARSATTQASGTYNNVITFYAVGKPAPLTIDDLEYAQEFGTIAETDLESVKASMPEEVTYILKDKRDDQDYTIAKLKDGEIWMTKNLNLAGGSVINSELSDVPDGYILPMENNFQSGNKLPDSATAGFNDDTKAFVYNSTKTTGADCSNPGCYSYYSWTAATVGSKPNVNEEVNADYSICPRGWKLPSSGYNNPSDFHKLAAAYGANSGQSSQDAPNFYNQAGPGTIPNFLLAGYYYNGSLNYGGSRGYYWSSTSSYNTLARFLTFRSTYFSPVDYDYIRRGLSIHCIAR